VTCTPNGTTVLHHPYTCHDGALSEIQPIQVCDPNNGHADCDEGAGETCRQSFTTTYAVTKTDSIPGVEFIFGTEDGESCTLNPSTDNIGWYELFTLEDRTPGDTTDDCFDLTVGLCCTDPVRMPYWPFVSRYIDCPCVEAEHVDGFPPDLDENNQPKSGFGPASLANIPCEDGNASMSVTLPPGQYGYQIHARRECEGTTVVCEDDADCPGIACVNPSPDYTLHFSVQSCEQAACCLGDSCIVTNRLDCEAQLGNFLGDDDPPITLCPSDMANPCAVGACCIDNGCRDGAAVDTQSECESEGGVYFVGGASCLDEPCPACRIESSGNCQQAEGAFGTRHLTDRNPTNGLRGTTTGFARVAADDVIFNGDVVDNICWLVAMLTQSYDGCVQSTAFDNTWEIRLYESDVTGGIPGAEFCFSTLSVSAKVEGTGEATGTWQYSGMLDTPCVLPNGGVGGDKYWFEISGFGDDGCSVRAISAYFYEGNNHAAWSSSENPLHTYTHSQVLDDDLGFCEDDGITFPRPVLGTCCECPDTCTTGLTQAECRVMGGRWVLGGTCAAGECPFTPPNDDCANAIEVNGVPAPGTGELTIDTNNICATADGPWNVDQSCDWGAEVIADIWYHYVAEHCGNLTIQSCGDAAHDQIFAMYDATSGCPVSAFDEVACDDDGCGVEGGESSLTLSVNVGDELLFRVGGWFIIDGFIPIARSDFTLHFSYDNPCPVTDPPMPAPPPHDILKNRYISLVPGNTDIGQFDIKLTLTATEVNGVTAVGSSWWAKAPGADCVSVLSPTQPASPPNWNACPVVHLTGCPIIPTSFYDAVTVFETRESGVLSVSTQAMPTGGKWWGDVVGQFDPAGDAWGPPNGVVAIDDAVAAIKTFQNPSLVGPGCGTPPCNATHVSVTDVHPAGFPQQPWGTPNQLVDINDVFAILLGFQGNEYPGPAIDLCADP